MSRVRDAGLDGRSGRIVGRFAVGFLDSKLHDPTSERAWVDAENLCGAVRTVDPPVEALENLDDVLAFMILQRLNGRGKFLRSVPPEVFPNPENIGSTVDNCTFDHVREFANIAGPG